MLEPKIKRWIQAFIGILISAGFLYLTFQAVDLGRLRAELRTVKPGLLLSAGLIGATSNFLRTLRWRVLLEASSSIKLRFLFSSMMIGYLANNILPARAGELVRVYVLERRTGMSKSIALASVVLERLIDVLVLLIFVMLFSFFFVLPDAIQSGSQIGLLLFGSFALILLGLAWKGEVFVDLLGMQTTWLGQRGKRVLQRFIDGLRGFRSRRQAAFVLALTVLVWCVEAVSTGLIIKALGLRLPWFAALFVLVVVSLSFVIPAAPGAVGTYEFFVVTALVPFAVEEHRAVGFAILLHAVMYAASTILGLLSLWAESLTIRDLA